MADPRDYVDPEDDENNDDTFGTSMVGTGTTWLDIGRQEDANFSTCHSSLIPMDLWRTDRHSRRASASITILFVWNCGHSSSYTT
jgi:hypothetical protein